MVAAHGVTLFATLWYVVKRLNVSFLRKQEFIYLMLPCLVGIAVTQSLRSALLLDEGLVMLLSPLYTVPVPLAGVLMLFMLAASVKLYKELEYIEFYDNNGEMVVTYSNNGWTIYTTNAEAARKQKLYDI